MNRKEWKELSSQERPKQGHRDATIRYSDEIADMKNQRPGVKVILHHNNMDDQHYENWDDVTPMFEDDHLRLHSKNMTSEWRENIRRANINRFNDPAELEKLAAAQRKRFSNPKERKRVSESCKKTMSSDKYREKRRKIAIDIWKDPERRGAQSRMVSKQNLGRHWFTNGVNNCFVYECPEGFRPGVTYNGGL